MLGILWKDLKVMRMQTGNINKHFSYDDGCICLEHRSSG